MSVVQIIMDDGTTKSWIVNDETAKMVRAIIVLTHLAEESNKSP